MSKENLHKQLQLVTVENVDYLCIVTEPADDKPNARTKISHAVACSGLFTRTVDQWICESNTKELISMTIGKNQGYTIKDLQEDQVVVLQTRVDFMEVTKKLALARMQNSQYTKFIEEL